MKLDLKRVSDDGIPMVPHDRIDALEIIVQKHEDKIERLERSFKIMRWGVMMVTVGYGVVLLLLVQAH